MINLNDWFFQSLFYMILFWSKICYMYIEKDRSFLNDVRRFTTFLLLVCVVLSQCTKKKVQALASWWSYSQATRARRTKMAKSSWGPWSFSPTLAGLPWTTRSARFSRYGKRRKLTGKKNSAPNHFNLWHVTTIFCSTTSTVSTQKDIWALLMRAYCATT